MKSFTLFFNCLFFISCSGQVTYESLINKDKKTIQSRFNAPSGYEIIQGEAGSYAHYLQNLPLKPNGTDVLLYNGSVKRNKVHAAIIDMEIGKKDLQQCADAIMRLRGEYLYQANRKNEIAFNFTNGFRVAYSEWAKGNRMQVKGNETKWVKQAAPSDTYADFRKYMELIFNYAGTKSLEKELVPVNKITDIQIGDVFIQGGSPGHAVVVVNIAKTQKTGEKLFLLAQSYMPAQDIHILNNPKNKSISPWYSTHFDGELVTPEWTFQKDNLKRFK